MGASCPCGPGSVRPETGSEGFVLPRLALTSFLILLLLAGCAVFTRPATTISVERQKFVNAYARARVLYQHLASRMEALCQSQKLAQETCAKAEAINQQAKMLDAEIRAQLDVPESEVDWERIMRLLELAVGFVL